MRRNCIHCKKRFTMKEYQIRKCEYVCQSCRAERFRVWQAEHRAKRTEEEKAAERRKVNAYMRETYKNPEVRARRIATMKKYRQTDRFKAYAREYQRKTYLNPKARLHQAARRLLSRAVECGVIQKQPCVECGDVKAWAHHPDYMKALDVVWLCLRCHKALHMKLKATEGNGNGRGKRKKRGK